MSNESINPNPSTHEAAPSSVGPEASVVEPAASPAPADDVLTDDAYRQILRSIAANPYARQQYVAQQQPAPNHSPRDVPSAPADDFDPMDRNHMAALIREQLHPALDFVNEQRQRMQQEEFHTWAAQQEQRVVSGIDEVVPGFARIMSSPDKRSLKESMLVNCAISEFQNIAAHYGQAIKDPLVQAEVLNKVKPIVRQAARELGLLQSAQNPQVLRDLTSVQSSATMPKNGIRYNKNNPAEAIALLRKTTV